MRRIDLGVAVLGLLGAGLGGPGPAAAQNADWPVVDRIVAVVGGRPITLSRLQEEINVSRATGGEVPTDSAALNRLRRQVLNRMVDAELILQAAQRDTAIQVSSQQVLAAVDDVFKQIRQQYGTEFEFEQQLVASGFGTVDEYRRWLMDQKRRDLMQRQLLQKLQQKGQLRPVPPTEAEIRQFYEENKDRAPKRPASVSLRQIVVQPEPDSAAVAAAHRRADSLLLQLRRGADFASAARRFSADPTTKEQGGELGWFRRGQMTPAFDAVAWSLRPGQISNPVRTPFGWHIIQVQRVEPAEIQARHILIAPEITDANRAAAGLRGDSVVALLKAGAPVDSITRRFADPNEQTLIEDLPRTALPDVYAEALAGAKESDVIGPFPIDATSGLTKHVVIILLEDKAEGELTYEDLKPSIRQQLTDESVMTRYTQQLRKMTYVDVRL